VLMFAYVGNSVSTKVVPSTLSDSKTSPEEEKKPLAVVPRGLRMARSKSMKPMRVRLYVADYTKVSGANAALTDATYITPANCSLFSNCASLFDEYRCLGGEITFGVQVSSASSTIPRFMVVGYDAFDTGAPTSVAVARNMLYNKLVALTLTGTSPLSAQANGLWNVRFKLPKGPAVDATSLTAPSSSQWIATNDTYQCGVIQTYAEAVAAAGVVSVQYSIAIDLEFRCRR